MAEYSYGVVVEQYESGFGIWLLFRGIDSGLTSLDAKVCADRLSVGDIVQATTIASETRISRYWSYPNSVWADGAKLVIRTIASYSKEVTIDAGKWKDDISGDGVVMLVSRDLGHVVAPIQWYNREFSDAVECHLFIYVQFVPRKFTNFQTGEQTAFYWQVIEDRIALPAVPSNNKDPEKFLDFDELRKVPALTIQRHGNSMLMWSYALGDRVAILLDSTQHTEIGEWLLVTVIPSSERDFTIHGCCFTILKHGPVAPFSQPEIGLNQGKITMTLSLNRSETPGVVKLWHEFWGLPIRCDDPRAKWMGDNGEFRAVVEVSMTRKSEGRRVSIKAIGPAPMPRACKSPAPFENLDEIKQALLESSPNQRQEEAEPDWTSNNNNNDDQCADKTKCDETRVLQSPAEQRFESAGSAQSESSSETATSVFSSPTAQQQSAVPKWDDNPKKELKGASNSSSTEGGLDWKNWGKGGGQQVAQRRQYERGWSSSSNVGRQGNQPPGNAGGSWGGPVTPGGITHGGATASFSVNALPVEKKELTCEEKEKGWVGPAVGKPGSGFSSANIVGPVPIRAFEDKDTERKWKAEMTKKGWYFPPEPRVRISSPDDDEWYQEGATPFPETLPEPVKPPMPVEQFLNKRTIVRDVMKLKSMQCIITKVRFDYYWKEADRIQLFVLSDTPAYIVHRICGFSYIKHLPEFTTVGNVIELHVGRHQEGFFVHDEMWRFVTKVKMPMREIVFEDARVKTLELIVSAKCLSQEAQNRHNDRWRYNNKGFTMLNEEIIHNITYFGKDIDPRENEDYNFQVVVVPEECLDAHAFWKATDVLWRIKKETIADCFLPVEPAPSLEERTNWPPPTPRVPVPVEFKESQILSNYYAVSSDKWPVTVPREARMDEILALYTRLMENDALMTSLHTRTGTNYKKKFISAIEVAQSSKPHCKSMKRELQVNADFLISIIENEFAEGIFRDIGERRLWKLLVKTADGIKAFRSTVNNR